MSCLSYSDGLCFPYLLLVHPCCDFPRDAKDACYYLSAGFMTYISGFRISKRSEAIKSRKFSCRGDMVTGYSHFIEIFYYLNVSGCSEDDDFISLWQSYNFRLALLDDKDRVYELPFYVMESYYVIPDSSDDLSYWHISINYKSKQDISGRFMAGIGNLLRSTNDSIRFIVGSGSFMDCESALFVDLRSQNAVIDLPFHTMPVRLEVMNYYKSSGIIRFNAPLGTTVEGLPYIELDASQIDQFFFTYDTLNNNYFMAYSTFHLLSATANLRTSKFLNLTYYTPTNGAQTNLSNLGWLFIDNSTLSSTSPALEYDGTVDQNIRTSVFPKITAIDRIFTKLPSSAIAVSSTFGNPVYVGFLATSKTIMPNGDRGFARNWDSTVVEYWIHNTSNRDIYFANYSNNSGGSPVNYSAGAFASPTDELYLDNGGSALTVTSTGNLGEDYADSTTTNTNMRIGKYLDVILKPNDWIVFHAKQVNSVFYFEEISSIAFQEGV